MNWITRFWNYLMTWRSHRTVIKELNKLTDRELADIGISRGQIDYLVWHPEDYEQRGGHK